MRMFAVIAASTNDAARSTDDRAGLRIDATDVDEHVVLLKTDCYLRAGFCPESEIAIAGDLWSP